jgi:hypothetical protein
VAEPSKQTLNAYKKAFSGFMDDEMAVLDGIILEPLEAMQRLRNDGSR